MTTRPGLDAWLAEADQVVRGGDDYLPDGMRCRPDDGQQAEPGPSHVERWLSAIRGDVPPGPTYTHTVLDTTGPDMTQERFESLSAAMNITFADIQVSLSGIFEAFGKIATIIQEAIDLIESKPTRMCHGVHGVVCPRHGPMKGGTCYRCRR